MKETLKAKVIARNRLNNAIKDMAPKILEMLKPLVGEKILLQGGGLSMKAKKILNPIFEENCSFSRNKNLHICRYPSNYTLSLTFKTSENDSPNTCIYQEATVNFGEFARENFVLEKLTEFKPEYYPSDYSVDKIIETRKKIQELDNQKRDLEYSICNFGLHDNF